MDKAPRAAPVSSILVLAERCIPLALPRGFDGSRGVSRAS
jgi:hypothetical protein